MSMPILSAVPLRPARAFHFKLSHYLTFEAVGEAESGKAAFGTAERPLAGLVCGMRERVPFPRGCACVGC